MVGDESVNFFNLADYLWLHTVTFAVALPSKGLLELAELVPDDFLPGLLRFERRLAHSAVQCGLPDFQAKRVFLHIRACS